MKTYVAVPTVADDQDLDVGHIRDTWTTWMNGHKEDIKALENKLSLSEANADNAVANAEKLYSDQITELKNALALANTTTTSNASTTGDSNSSISLYAAELEKVAKDKEALQHSLTGNISSTLLLLLPPLLPSHHHHYHHYHQHHHYRIQK